MQPSATPSSLPAHEQLDHAWRLLNATPTESADIARPLREHPQVATRAHTVLSAAALHSGQHAEALPAASAAADRLRAQGDHLWLTRALTVAALAADALGQRELALTHYHETLEVARALDNLSLQGLTLLNIGVLWFITDRAKAAEYFRSAVTTLEAAAPEGQGNLAHAYVNLGILEYEAGQHSAGVTFMTRGRDLALNTNEVGTWVSAVAHLAQVHTERGDAAAARAEVQDALTRFPGLPGGARRQLLYVRVIVEHHAGEYQQALDAFEELQGAELTELEQQALYPIRIDAHAKLGQFDRAYPLSQELVAFNEQIYKKERETQLLKLEERHQAESARREAEVKRLEAEAAQREAELAHLENVELQRALESNAILIQSLRDSQQVSETLLGVSHLMQLDLEPLDLARHALALVTQIIDADWCTLARIHSDEVTFEPVWARDDEHETFVRTILPSMLDVREPLLQRSARQDEPTFVSNYQTSPAAHPDLTAAGLRGFASLPAGTAFNFTYVLLLGRMAHDRRWSEREQRVLGATGRSLRAAVETQERTRRSREAALIDVLTGLANRRAFETQLREARAQDTFSVAMLDLDHLKLVNDTRGHAAGDTLLQVFAFNLRTHALDSMQPFRLGGDELALLITHASDTSEDTVQAAVQEVLDATITAVRSAGFPEAGCSSGVARWPDDAAMPVDVVALADSRLYADKQARKARAGSARAGSSQPAALQDAPVVFGDALLDVQTRDLRGPLGEAKLSPREVELLRTLAARAPSVVSRADLTESSGIAGSETGGALDVHVSHVRRKLAAVTQHAGIRTLRGQGFSLQWYASPSDE